MRENHTWYDANASVVGAGEFANRGFGFNGTSVHYDYEHYNMPNVSLIGARAFFNNVNVMDVSFPNVKVIGDGAFNRDLRLRNVYMPNVEEIGKGAFAWTRIKRLDLPNVKTVGEGAFGLASTDGIDYSDYVVGPTTGTNYNYSQGFLAGGARLSPSATDRAVVINGFYWLDDMPSICNTFFNWFEAIYMPNISSLKSPFGTSGVYYGRGTYTRAAGCQYMYCGSIDVLSDFIGMPACTPFNGKIHEYYPEGLGGWVFPDVKAITKPIVNAGQTNTPLYFPQLTTIMSSNFNAYNSSAYTGYIYLNSSRITEIPNGLYNTTQIPSFVVPSSLYEYYLADYQWSLYSDHITSNGYSTIFSGWETVFPALEYSKL